MTSNMAPGDLVHIVDDRPSLPQTTSESCGSSLFYAEKLYGELSIVVVNAPDSDITFRSTTMFSSMSTERT